MWSRLFLTSLCLLSVLALKPLSAADNPIQLKLQRAMDNECDGIPDTTAKAIPGSCIIYEITALNTSNTTYQNVVIAAQIPQQATLIQTYRYSHNQQALPSEIARRSGDTHLIKTRLNTLRPGIANQVSVNYLVKIR